MSPSLDYFTATHDDLIAAGFRRWEDGNPLLLCPASIFGTLPDGICMFGIDGDRHVKGRDRIGMDTRFGFLAYGLIPGRTADAPSAEEVAAKDAERRAAFRASVLEVVRESGIYTSSGHVTGDEAERLLMEMFGNDKASQ